jgi:hypothetical protein
MSFKPYCTHCRTWHTNTEGYVATKAKALIDAAEATVMINDPVPAERNRGMVIVGFRVHRDKAGLASLVGAFNEMVDLAEQAIAAERS